MRYCKNCAMHTSLPQVENLEEGECEVCGDTKPCMDLPAISLSKSKMKEVRHKMTLKKAISK